MWYGEIISLHSGRNFEEQKSEDDRINRTFSWFEDGTEWRHPLWCAASMYLQTPTNSTCMNSFYGTCYFVQMETTLSIVHPCKHN